MKDKPYTTLFRKDISIDAEHKPVLPIITTMSCAQLSMRRGTPKDMWKEKGVQKEWYFFKLQAADTIVPCHWCHCCQNLKTPTVGKGYVCTHYTFVFSNEVNHFLILFPGNSYTGATRCSSAIFRCFCKCVTSPYTENVGFKHRLTGKLLQ